MVSSKLNVYLPYDRAIPILGVYATGEEVYAFAKIYTNVHSSFICNSPQLEIARMSITISTHGYIVIYPNNGMLLSHKGDEVWGPTETGKEPGVDAEWKELT